MKDVQSIWEQILLQAEQILPEKKTDIDIWLRPRSPLRMEGGELIVDAGNSFIASKITDIYLSVLNKIIVDLGLGTSVSLTLGDKPAQPDQPRPEIRQEKRPHIGDNGLNRQYDFASFVVGKSNRLAQAASLAAAEGPGVSYNPLFLHGGVGLGKTHLMHAIGNYVLAQNPNAKVLYLSSEKFTNDLITAIKNGSTAQFRSRYRHVDVLLIDDIQFLAGKESTQEEFFHTFNDLYYEQKQIVITSDRPPKDLDDIEERIRSRFMWGYSADIKQPDYETRIAILKKKAEQRRYPVNDDVINFLAENIPSNIRELEGALNRVIASASFSQMPITIENTREWLKDLIDANPHGMVSLQSILELVGAEFGFSPDDILGKRRTSGLALARQTAMYLYRAHSESSLQQIAKEFDKKDHTTVLHAVKKIEKMVEDDSHMRALVENIEKKL